MEENIVRVGTVTAVDAKARKARVLFQDMGFTSDWLAVLQHGQDEAWLPRVNDIAVVLYLPVWQGDGYILGVL
jgi:phage baseplate assembly protein gpV